MNTKQLLFNLALAFYAAYHMTLGLSIIDINVLVGISNLMLTAAALFIITCCEIEVGRKNETQKEA